jgi:predicted 5'-methylthioadenosine/S-adenosylhomocysteine nucleosidase
MAAEAPHILIAMALSAESAGVFHDAGIDVLYTGVGKVNAAIALTRRLAHLRHAGLRAPLVVNFGTAGSARIPARTLVACRKFVDRDMDVGALGFAAGVTPYDEACRMEGVHFACAKYVSDNVDENSAAHWKENVAGAAGNFLALYRDLVSGRGASRA